MLHHQAHDSHQSRSRPSPRLAGSMLIAMPSMPCLALPRLASPRLAPSERVPRKLKPTANQPRNCLRYGEPNRPSSLQFLPSFFNKHFVPLLYAVCLIVEFDSRVTPRTRHPHTFPPTSPHLEGRTRNTKTPLPSTDTQFVMKRHNQAC